MPFGANLEPATVAITWLVEEPLASHVHVTEKRKSSREPPPGLKAGAKKSSWPVLVVAKSCESDSVAVTLTLSQVAAALSAAPDHARADTADRATPDPTATAAATSFG